MLARRSTCRARACLQLWGALLLVSFVRAQQALDTADGRAMDFARQMEKVHRDLQPFQASCVPLLDSGHLEEVVDCLLSAVPESSRTPVHDFVLGDLVAPADRDLSWILHQRAHDADPDNPLLARTWAFDLCYAGEYARAAPVLAALSVHPAYWQDGLQAVAADAFLRAGHPGEALSAWRELDVAAQTSAIERALALAHPPRSPWTRRAELLHAVTDHDAGAARDLILLDLRFDADAGTWCRRDDYLRADLALLDAGFGAESRRVRELKALVLLDQTLPPDSAKRSRRTSPNPTSFKGAKEELSRLELIGHDPFMALEPPVARRLFDLFVETGYSTATEILDVFTDVFEDKIHWERGDQESLRTYCQLLEAADRPQRADVARYGWDRYAEPQCAAILIEASMAAGSPDAELVETSLATCPGDERLLRLAVNLDERAGRLPSVARLSALLIATANSSPSVQDMDRLYTELERSLQAESESR